MSVSDELEKDPCDEERSREGRKLCGKVARRENEKLFFLSFLHEAKEEKNKKSDSTKFFF